jgi:hypothetical protein
LWSFAVSRSEYMTEATRKGAEKRWRRESAKNHPRTGETDDADDVFALKI